MYILYICICINVYYILHIYIYVIFTIRQNPEVCPDSQHASGQAKMTMTMTTTTTMMMMAMMAMMMILISSGNPIRNPNDCMVSAT